MSEKKRRKTIWIENHLLVYASMKMNDVPNLHVKWQPNKFQQTFDWTMENDNGNENENNYDVKI